MKLTPVQYKFNERDSMRIEALGYTVINEGTLDFSLFMASEFPDFDLVSLLEEVERSFTPTTKLFINRRILFSVQPCSLRIDYHNEFNSVEEALVFDREFSKSNNRI